MLSGSQTKTPASAEALTGADFGPSNVRERQGSPQPSRTEFKLVPRSESNGAALHRRYISGDCLVILFWRRLSQAPYSPKREMPMTAVVVTHTVGNIDTWLKGGVDRKRIFPNFCSSHRIFRHPDQANRISIVCENVDLAKLKATMDSAEAKALIGKHTVIEPIEFYIEVDGGS
jgi:hypothetical protein